MTITMAPPVAAIIGSSAIARVATVSADGSPHLAPFWFSFDGDRVYLDTVENQTVRNLRRNPRAAVLIDVGTSFGELKGASLVGLARLHDESSAPANVLAGVRAVRAAHAEEIKTELFARYLAQERRPVVLVEIDPDKSSWWDLAALARRQ